MNVGQTVEEISTTEGLEALAASWEELQARSAPDNIFLTFDWASAWWRHLGAGRRLRLLAVRDGGQVSGLVPLVEGSLGGAWAPFRRLQLLGTGLSDRLDFLLPDDPAAGVERALSHLLKNGRRWDLIDLRELAEDSPSVNALRAAAGRLGLEFELLPDSECPYFPIEGDWERFFTSRFSGDTRREMRRKGRKLAGVAPVSLRILEGIPTGSPILEQVAAIQQEEVYRGEERRSIFGTEEKRAFFADVLARLSSRGRLHLSILDLDGRPTAFRLAFLHASKYMDYYSAFQAEYRSFSPGSTLLLHVLEDCFRRGLREVDFLRGTEPWKDDWTDRRRRNVRVRLLRSGLRGSAVKLLLAADDRRRQRSSPGAE